MGDGGVAFQGKSQMLDVRKVPVGMRSNGTLLGSPDEKIQLPVSRGI